MAAAVRAGKGVIVNMCSVNAVVLASDTAANVTGSDIRIDSGLNSPQNGLGRGPLIGSRKRAPRCHNR
jgi:hypothetical protein